MNQNVIKTKPMRKRNNWPRPAIILPPMSEPSPGVANRFINRQLRAAEGLSVLAPENIFIRVTYSCEGKRGSKQNANSADADAGNIDKAGQDQQAQYVEPMIVHHFETGEQRGAKAHAFVDNQGDGKIKTHVNVSRGDHSDQQYRDLLGISGNEC